MSVFVLCIVSIHLRQSFPQSLVYVSSVCNVVKNLEIDSRHGNTDQSNHACTRVRQMYLQHGSELCIFVVASMSGSRKHYERHVVEQFQLVSVHKSLDTTAARYNAKCSCGFFPLFVFLKLGDVGDEEHVHSVFPARTYCAHTEKRNDGTPKDKGFLRLRHITNSTH